MNKITKFALLIAATLFTASLGVQAAPITGNIGFGGSVTLDTGSAGTATAVTAWHFAGNMGSPYVAVASGDFSSSIGMSVTFAAPWSFNSGALPNFWAVNGFTFDLSSSAITSQGVDSNGQGYVVVNGSGTISGNGFDPTPGTFAFSSQDPSGGGVFSFSAATGAIPEPSTTALIVAGTLLVGFVFRSGFRKA